MEKDLDKARKLLLTRKYSEVLDIITKIEEQNAIVTEQHEKRIFNLKMRALHALGKLEQEYKSIDQDIKNYANKEDWLNVLDLMILKIRIKFIEIKREDIIKIASEGEEIIKQIKKKTPALLKKRAWFYYWKGDTYLWSLDAKNAIKFLQLSLKLADELSDLEIKRNSLHKLGVVYGWLSDFELSINYMEQALEIFEKVGDNFGIPQLYHNLSVSHAYRGEYEKSREYLYKFRDILGETPLNIIAIGDSYWREGELEKGLEFMRLGLKRIQDQLDNPDEHQLVLFYLGNLLSRQGELDKALEKYKKCIEISIQKNVRPQPWGYFDIGIATCYLHKGELNNAKEYALEALEKFEKNKEKYGLGWAHFLLARIHYEKNEHINSLIHAQSSLDYRQEIGNKQEMALTLRWIITLLLENKNFEEANSFFDQIKEIAKTSEDMIIDRSFRLSEALMLKAKTRPKYWIKAIDILEDLANDRIVDYGITVTALILLCELLLNEFSISGDEEVLFDLQIHTSRVVEIAKQQNSYSLRVEAYNMRILSLWIQAQYSKVDVEIQNARVLLLEARELADEKGLVKLAQKIENQHSQLLEQLQNWDEFIRKYYEFIKN